MDGKAKWSFNYHEKSPSLVSYWKQILHLLNLIFAAPEVLEKEDT